MKAQKMFQARHAVARLTVVMVLIAIIIVAVIGTVLTIRYYTNTNTNTAANSMSSVFQPIGNFGNGTWQFEENNLHVYNYTWSGTVAAFNTKVNGTVIVPPTLCDGLLLVDVSNGTAMTGGVVAINMQNGKTVWTTTVPNLMMSQPLTYEGLVIIGLGNNVYRTDTTESVRGAGTNYVAALNFSTGKTVWTFPTLGEDMPTPVIYNSLVVFANGNGVVYALNASTGQEVWNASLPSGAFVSMSSPALVGDSIYFGENDPYTFDCVNLTDGQTSWSTPTPATGGLDDCSPVVWNGVVISGYTTTTSTGLLEPVLFGMNATNGQTLWQFDENPGPQPSGGEWFTPVTVWNGIVYSDSPENGTLYAVNVASGVQLWAFSTGLATCNVNVFDGYLWIVNSKGTLFVIDPATGALLNSTSVGVPVLDGSVVFVGQNVIIWGNGQVVSMPTSDIYPID
jgi:outer membrane protein assembly factor BamB